MNKFNIYAQVAQLVEQATENRCVGGSIPPLGTLLVLAFLSSCSGEENYYPDTQGKHWNYKISISSDYTNSKDEMRLSVTNIKTVIGGKGITFSKLYSNGDMLTFFKNKKDDSLSRIGAFVNNHDDLLEPVIKVINPSIDFKISNWKNKNQLFFTRGFQPPLRGFKPNTIFDMNFEIVSHNANVRVKAGNFNNCVHVKGNGSAEFIADTRASPNKVTIISDEWICPNIGIVKEKRIESTDSLVFGSQEYTRELISINK